jgi:hypothetical protein
MHTIVYPSHTRTRKPGRRAGAGQRWSRPARIIAILLALAAIAALTATMIAPGVRAVSIPAGTGLVVSLQESVSASTARAGQPVVLETVEPIKAPDDFMLPAGVVVRGAVSSAQGSSRAVGGPELTIQLTEMEVQGQTYPIVAEPFQVRGSNGGKGDELVLAAGRQVTIRLAEPVTVQYSGKNSVKQTP